MTKEVRRSMLAAALVLTVAACEPAPPPAVLQVTTFDAGSDVTPGDGVCETEPGNGVCTLTAAVQEANALGKAIVDVPEQLDISVEPALDVPAITGDITLRSTHTIENPAVGGRVDGGLHVAAGGALRLEGFTLLVMGGLDVDGSLAVDRSGLAATVHVGEGGALVVSNSLLVDSESVPDGASMITNDGSAVFTFSQVSTMQPLLHTGPSGRTVMGATILTGPDGLACTGTPVESQGYNIDFASDPGGSCFADQTNPRDAVPFGELGCGTTVTVDNRGLPRPALDGPQRCDAGPREPSFGG